MAFAIFGARIRIPLLAVAGLMILLGVVMDRLWVSNVGFVALIIGLALYFRVGTARKEPLVVRPPVVGRWAPVNSPPKRLLGHSMSSSTSAITRTPRWPTCVGDRCSSPR